MRPRLAWPFTIAPHGEAVWLVAGEDVRVSLRGDATWIAPLLRACDGRRDLDALVADVAPAHRAAARELLADLAGERLLVDGSPLDLPAVPAPCIEIAGTGVLADALRASASATATATASATASATAAAAAAIRVLAQDDLDLPAALATAAASRGDRLRFVWITLGPLARAYVSPLFLADAGPCLTCLLSHFKLLSPAPAVYDALLAHPGPFAAATAAREAVAAVAALAAWKLSLVPSDPPSAALYALHVVDLATLETSSHPVFRDPECSACRGS